MTATVTGLLPSTTYNFYLISRDDERNSSVASAIVSAITTAPPTGGSGATDLFFSEYVEGSGNNKALEIANFTGAAVNLVGYAVKKQSNGAGTWSTGFNLTGTLSTGQVFLIVDPGISTTCYTAANANLLSTSSELYNGNDPIGLFKNGVLIDIIGTFNGGSSNNFAADVTLRRKPSISAPNITYNETAEWDAYGKDVCNGLGAHSITNLSTGDVNSNDFTIYPNPSTGTVKINFSNGAEKHTIQIFTILGQQVYENEFSNSPSATINNLQKGFYLIKIKNETNSVTKKLIVN
ncbi:putative extracellular nuclease [Flavobacterium sp. PL11]|uniref:T9SS type A sorting domain-containing protein n=1 Tax=Flavobacterium sp. PL11 TaxID=3071717 RepID=UPI002E013A9B|nr:putative extracellular nuclease [Flavobacterium sp. PL11]